MVTGRIKLPDMLVEQSWLEALPDEFQKSYALALCMFVGNEYFAFKDSVYPPPHLIFDAFNTTPFHSVKAVILGQEPYSGPGQAMGLSFSVPRGVQFPSTLKNVLKEVKNDLDCKVLRHGNLEKWALQGVLLLNAVLTGRINENNANAHANIGWEQFTDAVIKTISEKKEGLVFLLWGEYAQEKIRLIDQTKHHILKAEHPSGATVKGGFFGCKHFSKTNQYLEQNGIGPIDWKF
ncbi:putative uracil-DNA glycosylase [Medicago truncatula]|nr:putative uracil-DNA glycosylase [Medicago truncatula]